MNTLLLMHVTPYNANMYCNNTWMSYYLSSDRTNIRTNAYTIGVVYRTFYSLRWFDKIYIFHE